MKTCNFPTGTWLQALNHKSTYLFINSDKTFLPQLTISSYDVATTMFKCGNDLFRVMCSDTLPLFLWVSCLPETSICYYLTRENLFNLVLFPSYFAADFWSTANKTSYSFFFIFSCHSKI